MCRLVVSLIVLCALSIPASSQDETVIGRQELTITDGVLTPEVLWALGRIETFAVAPDGKQIVYQVGYYSVAQNKGHHVLYVTNIDGTGTTLLTTTADNETDPAWLDHGQRLAYLCNGQLWAMNSDGTGRTQLTHDATDIDGYLFSPDKTKVILLKAIPYYGSIAQRPNDLPLSTGRVINNLNYRHWDHYVEEITHPFLAEVTADGITTGVDLLDGEPYECPMAPFGGVEELSWHPNSQLIAYSCKKVEGVDYAVSTDADIYLYDLTTGQTTNLCKPAGFVTPAIDPTKSISQQKINHLDGDYNVGYDLTPQFSPDGTQLAWLSQRRCGYESDRARLCVYTLADKSKRYVTEDFDTSVDSFLWSQTDSLDFFFTATWHGQTNIYAVLSDGGTIPITSCQADFGQIQLVPGRGCLVAERHDFFHPAELFTVVPSLDSAMTTITPLTHENDHLLSQLATGSSEQHWVETTNGEQMMYYVILPPHFDATKKYPTLLYCEGGPQSPLSQFWSYRWNFFIMASQGYVVIAPGRHGVTGFGTAWTEQVSQDWTGQAMDDYLTAIDDACDKLPYVARDRLGCVGASFGGFSVYYLAGHHNKRFKAFIAHDGAFNLEAMYTDTEEVWFSNWEYDDAFWNKDATVAAKRTYANSPHRFVDNWDTPILCIHGEKDYRINANQGFGAYNAAMLRGIPAQLLLFPDENHWVLKPQNGILWQRTFFAWLDRWLNNDAVQ